MEDFEELFIEGGYYVWQGWKTAERRKDVLADNKGKRRKKQKKLEESKEGILISKKAKVDLWFRA